MTEENEVKSQEDFGQCLAKLRKRAGLTQAELGKAIGVSNRVICYYEKETRHPPAGLLTKLATVLNISTDILLGLKPMPGDMKEDGRTTDAKFLKNWAKLPEKDKKSIARIVESIGSPNN